MAVVHRVGFLPFLDRDIDPSIIPYKVYIGVTVTTFCLILELGAYLFGTHIHGEKHWSEVHINLPLFTYIGDGLNIPSAVGTNGDIEALQESSSRQTDSPRGSVTSRPIPTPNRINSSPEEDDADTVYLPDPMSSSGVLLDPKISSSSMVKFTFSQICCINILFFIRR